MKYVKVLLMAFVTLFVLAACNLGGGSDDETVTINFDSRGGSAVSSIDVEQEALTVDLPTPTREGYLFLGWYLDAGLTSAFDVSALRDLTSLTLYAAWEELEPDEYTVSFDTLGGNTIADIIVLDGETISEPMTPVREGYAFAGWYTSSAFTIAFDFDTEITSDMTLYARWLDIYTVQYSVNDFIAHAEQVTEGDEASGPSDPVVEGYTFDGWFTSSAFTTEITLPFTPTDDTTLYARMIPNEVTLTFETYDGPSIDPLVGTFGSDIEAPAVPDYEGYVLWGWYLDEEFEEDFVFDTMPAGDVTIYARWIREDEIYHVGFYVDGEALEYQVVLDGDTFDEPIAPEKEGYTFIGWMLEGDFVDGETPVTGSWTLLAYYEANSYEVTMIGYDSQPSESISFNFGEPLTLTRPEEDGYVFAGWYLDAKFTEPLTYETMPAYDITVYARFIDESEPMVLYDVIMASPESAILEEVTVIYLEYLELEDMTLVILTDGTASIYMVIEGSEVDFALYDIISLEAMFFYEGSFPILAMWENLEIVGHDADFTPTIHDLDDDGDGLGDLDYGDPFMVGQFFRVRTFLLSEEGFTGLFVPERETYFPVFNISLSTTYDDLIDNLDHAYVEIVIGFMPNFGEETLVLYMHEYQELFAIELDEEAKNALLEALIRESILVEMYPGDTLAFPPYEPFFGSELLIEALGDYEDYYDSENDRFLWTDEDVVISFKVTLTRGDIVHAFDVDVTLRAPDKVMISEMTLDDVNYVDVIVLMQDGDFLILWDGSGVVIGWDYTGYDFEVGNRYTLELWPYESDDFTQVYVDRVFQDIGEDTLGAPTEMTLEAIYAMATPSDGEYAMVEGVIYEDGGLYFIADGEYRMRLMFGDTFNPEDYLGEWVQVNLFVIESDPWEGVLRAYAIDGYSSITIIPLSDEELFAKIEEDMSQVDRDIYPETTIFLPSEHPYFDVLLEYASDDYDVVINDHGDYIGITFMDTGEFEIDVIVKRGEIEHTFTITFYVDYPETTSINEAIQDYDAGEYTFMVEVVGINSAGEYLLTDGEGLLFMNMGEHYSFNIGDQFIVSGTLEMRSADGYTLSFTTLELYINVDIVNDPPFTTDVDSLSVFSLNEWSYFYFLTLTGTLEMEDDQFVLRGTDPDNTLILSVPDAMRAELTSQLGNEITVCTYYHAVEDDDASIREEGSLYCWGNGSS